MFKIGICDDNAIDRIFIKNICVQVLEGKGVEVKLYENGEEFFESSMEEDLLFLDIEMKNMDGIQIKERLERMNSRMRIIFVTNHSEVMPQAFGMRVCGFISKPPTKESVKLCLDKIIHYFDERNYCILKATTGNIKVLFDDIIYIESDKHYCNVWLGDGSTKIVRANISDIEKTLPEEDFFRCHKSYLVNLQYVEKIGSEIKLVTGINVFLSKKKKAKLKQSYCEYVQMQVSKSWNG